MKKEKIQVSIPLWFDSNHYAVLIYQELLLTSLNSTMVRFKPIYHAEQTQNQHLSQFHYGSIQTEVPMTLLAE